MQKATTSDLKNINKKNILRHIYSNEAISNAEIAADLQLSRPTVTQCIKELEQERLIRQNGLMDSTGGRKAIAYSFVAETKIAVGVELLADRFEIIAIDLRGKVINYNRHAINFSHSNMYYDVVCREIKAFITSLQVEEAHILGVGIVIQGLISSDGKQVTYGKILGCTGLNAGRFEQTLKLPCRLFHDAESAATIELWEDQKIKNAILFNLRTNLSGALIVDGQFLKGNDLKSGVFEHMKIVPGGELCYCGKRGCFDAYCSYPVLLKNGGNLQQFFSGLRRGDSVAAELWNKWMSYMADAIDNLHMVIDYDIILTGTLSRYMNEEDVTCLHEMVSKRSAFPTEGRFIRLAVSSGSVLSRGAALPHIGQYLSTIM